MAKLNYFGRTDPGLIRSNNEDAFLIKPDIGFCLVADGVGGASAGEIASRIFVETALEVFSAERDQSENKTLERIKKAFRFAHERILKYVEQNPQYDGMACTAELIAFHEQGFASGHIGDSRTYRVRNGQLKQLTRDHSLVQYQIDQGMITPDDAKEHSFRNVIFQAVGMKDNLSLDILKGKTYPGDLFLLCSDGLTDMIDDSLIGQVLFSGFGLPRKTEKLLEMAKSAGGRDNITVVIAEIL